MVKNSGSFAGWTLLAGLLAATSVSLVAHVGKAEAARPAAVVPAAQQVQPAPAPATDKKQCVEIAQMRRAHQKAAAYALSSQEGPVADGGDEAGFFAEPAPMPVQDSTPPRCTDPQIL